MQPAAATSRPPGPLERTCIELARIERAAAFRRERESRWRRRLRESELLLDLVEQCRLRDYRLVPGQVWAAVVRFVGSVDPELRDDLGINRLCNHVADVLFAAQDELLVNASPRRHPQLAPIIQLFPGDDDAADEHGPNAARDATV